MSFPEPPVTIPALCYAATFAAWDRKITQRAQRHRGTEKKDEKKMTDLLCVFVPL
jgi:hypothetical protein